ncbi:GAF domain-containing sensor histidine kinase [Thalassotalea ganghwensis]
MKHSQSKSNPSLIKRVESLERELLTIERAKNIQKALYEIASLSNQDLEFHSLFEKLHRVIATLLDAKNLYFAFYDETMQKISFPYFVDEKDIDEEDMTGKTIDIGQGLSSYVIKERKSQRFSLEDVNQLYQQGKISKPLGATFSCWMAAPLISENSVLGLLVVQSYQQGAMYSEEDLKLLDFVASHVSHVIETNINTQQRREAQLKLAEQHRILVQKNKELNDNLLRLQRTQEELVQKEKLASLGSLVAGISHEINTPLGICVTGISHLKEEYLYTRNAYESGSLSEQELVDFFDEVKSAIDIIGTNTRRGAALVKSFKQVAVDQSSDNIRDINFSEYIDEILLSLKPKLKQCQHEIIVQCPKHICAQINAGAFAQILSNLILNSLIHGFENIEHGKIQIKVEQKDENIVFRYADNGQGLEQHALDMLFEPFYTTKRSEGGSGLGAHLIYNLVTQSLHGKITAQSQIDKGLAYLIKFPAIQGG